MTLAAFVALLLALHLDPLMPSMVYSLHPTSVVRGHSSSSPEYFAFFLSFASLARSFEGSVGSKMTTNMETPEISTISGLSNIMVAAYRNCHLRSTLILQVFLLLAGKKGGPGSCCHFLPSPDERNGFLN